MHHALPEAPFTRRAVAFVVAVLLATTGLAATSLTRARASSAGSILAATNAERSSHGVHALESAADLESLARAHAAAMARAHEIYHTPSLASRVCCWSSVGENVGVGSSASAVDDAFMASPPHRANILDRDYTQIGVGAVVGSDGRLYVDEIFRRPAGGSADPPPPADPPSSAPPTDRAATPRADRSSHRAPLLALSGAARAAQSIVQRLQATAPQRHAEDPLRSGVRWWAAMAHS